MKEGFKSHRTHRWLTPEQRQEVRRLLTEGVRAEELAVRFDVHFNTVRNIAREGHEATALETKVEIESHYDVMADESRVAVVVSFWRESESGGELRLPNLGLVPMPVTEPVSAWPPSGAIQETTYKRDKVAALCKARRRKGDRIKRAFLSVQVEMAKHLTYASVSSLISKSERFTEVFLKAHSENVGRRLQRIKQVQARRCA